MGLMYTFSVWTTRKVLDVYEHAWKAGSGWRIALLSVQLLINSAASLAAIFTLMLCPVAELS